MNPTPINSGLAEQITKALLADHGGAWRNGKESRRKIRHSCLFHDDPTPSADFYPDDGFYYCHAESAKHELGAVLSELGISWSGTFWSTNYTIRDEHGTPQAIHHRRDFIANGKQGKRLPWHRPDGQPSTRSEINPAELPPYGAELLKDNPTAMAVLVEGEKARDALQAIVNPAEVVVLGTVCGAGKIPCRRSLEPLRGRTAVVWPDNDKQGREHMDGIAAVLAELGCTVLVWAWNEAPAKGDAADYVAIHGGDLSKLGPPMPWTPAPAGKVTAGERKDGMRQMHPIDGLITVQLSEVERKEIDWLWYPYLVGGGFNLLAGVEGTGKSWLTLYLAGCLTRGWALPYEDVYDERGRRYWRTPEKTPVREASRVLFLSSEDSLEHVISNRFDGQGGDDTMFTAVRGTQDGERVRRFSLIDDLERLGRVLKNTDRPYSALVLDPITTYFGGSRRVDTFKESEVRQVLDPLAELADKHSVAVIGVMHWSKAGKERALHRVINSVAFTAASRSVLMFGKDPNEEESITRFLTAAKHNYAPEQPKSLEFRLELNKLLFVGDSAITSEALVSAPKNAETGRQGVKEATEFCNKL
jgi:hypothetical protein